jgi:hypothetical protein
MQSGSNKRYSPRSRVAVLFLALIIVLTPYTGAFADAPLVEEEAFEPPAPVLLDSRPVTAGTTMHEYIWEAEEGRPAQIYVLEVYLKNPYVQLGVIPGGGKVTERLNVSAMAGNAGAVAAVNGDFYNTQGEGAPIGPMVLNGRLVSSPSLLQDVYALGITQERRATISAFSFAGSVVASDGREFPLSGLNKTTYWEEPVGTHSHANRLHLYDDMWGALTRGHDSYTTPTEVLVDQGHVVDISRGKYFDFAVPEGMQILRGHGQAATFLDSLQLGEEIAISYQLSPAEDWSMIIGGHSLLVDRGQAIPYARTSPALAGTRARTAAGVSQDGSRLYLVGVEGLTASSAGLALDTLASFMESLGVWRALNLDGGGSSTMVARPLGSFELEHVFSPELGSERRVANAIGIWSQAPAGEVQGFILDGHDVVLIGEQAEYSLRAYDEYYNPLVPSGLDIKWGVTGPAASMHGNLFTADRSGTYQVQVASSFVNATIPVEVVGKRDLDALKLTAAPGQVVVGSEVALSLTLSTSSGKSRQVPAQLVDWQFHGLRGTVNDQGVLAVQEITGNSYGFVVARYQGFSAPLTLHFGSVRTLDDLQTLDNVSFRGQPSQVLGQLRLSSDPTNPAIPVVELAYDFHAATGTTAAYVQFADGGLALDDQAQALLIDVHGSKAGEWLRAELQDASGTIYRVNLSNRIDWSGWRTLQLNLQELSRVGELRLMRIYPVVIGEQVDQRPLQGTLLFKNLRQKYEAEPGQPIATPEQLLLTVDDRQMIIDGENRLMDVPPTIVGGRTLVPVRFISEALNASVLWDGVTRNVTVIQGQSWMDLWPGEDMMVVDGIRLNLDVAPQLINNRTMLPLRAVAQSLSLDVHWDPVTRQITLTSVEQVTGEDLPAGQ